jgi:hypothetical protein
MDFVVNVYTIVETNEVRSGIFDIRNRYVTFQG